MSKETKTTYSIEALTKTGETIVTRTSCLLIEARTIKNSLSEEWFCFMSSKPDKVVIKEYMITIEVIEIE